MVLSPFYLIFLSLWSFCCVDLAALNTRAVNLPFCNSARKFTSSLFLTRVKYDSREIPLTQFFPSQNAKLQEKGGQKTPTLLMVLFACLLAIGRGRRLKWS